MLTRLYVDNYKAFVNFELDLSGHALVLGSNGAGKSSLFEVIELLRYLLVEGAELNERVEESALTRWDQREELTFELEATDGKSTFAYRLVLRGFLDLVTVIEERLHRDGAVVFHRKESEAEVGNRKVVVDERHSVVPILTRHLFTLGVSTFVAIIERILVIHPEPRLMHAQTEREETQLDPTLANFASWWRLPWQEQPEVMQAAVVEIGRTLPGFRSMSIQRTREDERRMLTTHWDVGEPGGKTVPFKLHELSDGQRILIALQCVAAWLSSKGGTLIIDEPDNFLALAEIQPLLRSLMDAPDLQLILASHHPEVLNEMAREHGIRLWRDRNGPVRQERFTMPPGSGLTPAEHVA